MWLAAMFSFELKEELTSGGDMFWSTYSKSNYSGRQTGKTRM